MKKLLTVLSLLLIAGIFAATPEIKSDGTVCVDGVCYLPGMDPPLPEQFRKLPRRHSIP